MILADALEGAGARLRYGIRGAEDTSPASTVQLRGDSPHASSTMLKVSDVAQLLGIGRSTVYESIHRGEIPSIRVGRRVLVPIDALQALMSGSSTVQDDRRLGGT